MIFLCVMQTVGSDAVITAHADSADAAMQMDKYIVAFVQENDRGGSVTVQCVTDKMQVVFDAEGCAEWYASWPEHWQDACSLYRELQRGEDQEMTYDGDFGQGRII